MGEHFDSEDLHFEFERKFLVKELPRDVLTHGSHQVIAQAYLFAEEGYAVRVRLTFPETSIEFPPFDEAVDFLGAYERRQLHKLLRDAGVYEPDRQSHTVTATIAVKSPAIAGERYETENQIDIDVASQILRRSPNIILKNRHSLWYDEDGWEFDVFGGQNSGLVVAECERLGPVVDLKIPTFCVTEVTEDLRFSNDYLSKEPWCQWRAVFSAELEARGPHFLNLTGRDES